MKRKKSRHLPQFFEDLKEYCPQEVTKINEEDGENALIYGKPFFKIEKGYSYQGYIFLSDIISDYIGFQTSIMSALKKSIYTILCD